MDPYDNWEPPDGVATLPSRNVYTAGCSHHHKYNTIVLQQGLLQINSLPTDLRSGVLSKGVVGALPQVLDS